MCSVRVWHRSDDGKIKTIRERLGPGDYFGEMALLKQGAPRGATITATSSTVCLTLDRTTFRSLLGENIAHEMIEREAARRNAELERSRRPQITLADLEVVAMLGVGTYGRVKLVLHGTERTPHALKCMRKATVVAGGQAEQVLAEKALQQKCDHPFILRLVASFQDDAHLYMLLEVALGGELFTQLRAKGKLPEPHACFYSACVTSAIAYMHSIFIVYRDLKPENLLLDATGYVKVVDFGFAKLLTVDTARAWTLCGTPEYLAPEIVLSSGHTFSVDWWAMGILLFELLTGQPPFTASDPMEIYKRVLANRVSFPSKTGKKAKELISKLLVTNPSQRLGSLKRGSRDVVEHSWYKQQGVDFAALCKRTLPAPVVPELASATDTSHFGECKEANDGEANDGEEKEAEAYNEIFKEF